MTISPWLTFESIKELQESLENLSSAEKIDILSSNVDPLAGAPEAIAIGGGAISVAIDAVQIGAGVNITQETLQYKSISIADGEGTKIRTLVSGNNPPGGISPDEGRILFDRQNDRLYVASNGVWHFVALTPV